MRNFIIILSFLLSGISSFAQDKKEELPKKEELLIKPDSISKRPLNPLAPTRAAFYSAILPGLGQAYNKKYWKIPIVYGALGTGVYFYVTNNDEYHRFRNAYKRRLAGVEDEFKGQYSDATLINAQRTFQRNRDLSLLVTVGLYILNIVDANVDAHLLQFNVNDKLSFRPDIYPSEIGYAGNQNMGMTMKIQF